MPVTGADTERDLRYAMAGNRIRLVTNLVEVHPPSQGTVDPGRPLGRAVPAVAREGEMILVSRSPIDFVDVV